MLQTVGTHLQCTGPAEIWPLLGSRLGNKGLYPPLGSIVMSLTESVGQQVHTKDRSPDPPADPSTMNLDL